jgi:hypothetical protein
LAFVEILNEIEYTPCSAADGHTGIPTYDEWLEGRPAPARQETLRQLSHAAVDFVQERHPELLVTIDCASAARFRDLLPDNAQIADHHAYSDGVTQEIMKEAGITQEGFSDEAGPVIEGNGLLKSLLKDDIIGWGEVNQRGKNTRKTWQRYAWFYQNLDQEKYDGWCMAHFNQCRERIRKSIDEEFRIAAQFAHSCGLPLVVDEGFIFFPPLNSRFVMTPDGRWGEEAGVNAAIETGHWGIIPTGYFRPNTPLVWYDESQCEWIGDMNQRILNS